MIGSNLREKSINLNFIAGLMATASLLQQQLIYVFILVPCEAHLSSILIMLVCALDTSISKLQLLRIYEPLWVKACFGEFRYKYMYKPDCAEGDSRLKISDLEMREIQPKCAPFSFHICQNKSEPNNRNYFQD